MKPICKNCKHWVDDPDNYGYDIMQQYHSDKKLCEKLSNKGNEDDSGLISTDGVAVGFEPYTGENFGCIHFERKGI